MAMFGLALALPGAAAHPDHAARLPDFFGTWRVDRIAGYPEIGFGAREAEKDVGRPVPIPAAGLPMPACLCGTYAVTCTVGTVDAVPAGGREATRRNVDRGELRLGERAKRIDAPARTGWCSTATTRR